MFMMCYQESKMAAIKNARFDLRSCDLEGHYSLAYAIEDIRIKEPDQDLIDPDQNNPTILYGEKHVLLHIVPG
jgi:hypothetical protein